MQEATDLKILEKASQTNRILVSRDKGFGSLVFLGSFPSVGVILLRIDPMTVEQVHRELERLLVSHTEDELQSPFSLVEPHRYRIRHLE